MKKILFAFLGLLVGSTVADAQSASVPQYVLDKKIPVPGNGGYDYLTLDTMTSRLYISHGTSVAVLDVVTEKIVGTIDHLSGVHGIALAPDLHRGFISDGKGNSVVVFDLESLQTVKTIKITGKDPDAILFDPFTQRVFTFNGDSQDASVIDAVSLQQIGRVDVGGTPEFAVADGQGKIYNNLEDKSVLNVIDPKTLQVTAKYPLDPCGGPTGLALDRGHQRLFTVCRKNKGMSVIDLSNGNVVATVPIGAGVDAVSYDPATGLVCCSNGDGTATLIQQQGPDQYTVTQTLSTQWKAKTHAIDPKTKKLYFCAFTMDAGNKNRVPDSFSVLIYKPAM